MKTFNNEIIPPWIYSHLRKYIKPCFIFIFIGFLIEFPNKLNQYGFSLVLIGLIIILLAISPYWINYNKFKELEYNNDFDINDGEYEIELKDVLITKNN